MVNKKSIRIDPIVIDLDGDGIETISSNNSKAYFDLDGDKFQEKVEWVSKDDGLLVVDRNGNGKIDDISELFGDDEFVDGFEKLRAFYNNYHYGVSEGFNVIDEWDSNFDELKIWQDKNEDGITDEGELRSLKEAGINSIEFSDLSEEQKGCVPPFTQKVKSHFLYSKVVPLY
ncbi:MAG: hypothetical protein HQK79_08580 [Desulfobacterales bacterium]|nr:hypothetical protein [Desulfobacterales bacterium]